MPHLAQMCGHQLHLIELIKVIKPERRPSSTSWLL